MTPAAKPPLLDNAAIVAFGAALIAMAAMLFAPQVLNDPDSWWHLAAGRWMLRHGEVPTTDVFSYTMAGKPWAAHEWLSEVFMGAAYQLAGWSGVVILFGLSAGLAAGLLARTLSKWLSGLSLLVVVLLTFACVSGSFLVRPHVLVLPIMIAWMAEMLAAREEGRAPSLFYVPLMVIWANMHGSYVFGFVLLAPLALEGVIAATGPARRKALLGWGIFTLGCLVAAVLTPQGLHGLIFPFQLMTMTANASISEWRAADFSALGPFEIVLLASLFFFLYRGVKVPPFRLLLLVFLVHMALQHDRHLLILGIIGPMLLAEPLAQALGQEKGRAGPIKPTLLAGFAVVYIALMGARLALPLVRGDSPATPKSAIAALPLQLRVLPVLNEYGFGGYLIFSSVRPYIDGRADMYGDDYVNRYFKMVAPDARLLGETLDANQIAWTIFPPEDPVVALMDAKPGWRRIYADKIAVIHVRVDEPPAAVATLIQIGKRPG